MFHRRCNREIEHLTRLLDEERGKNKVLQEQIVTMADKPVVPVGANRPANIYYIDDARITEMEADGDLPT